MQNVTTYKKRVAIYARVSTLDKGQDPETQLMPLREFADHRGFEVVEELVDFASGTDEDRKNYNFLFDLVRKRKVDVVLIWRYDRFARSSQALINALEEFKSLGVDFISYTENIDTTTAQGELVFGIFASMAQFESRLISERVKAGMDRAKKQGKVISRPRISKETQKDIYDLWGEEKPMREISRKVGVSVGTVKNYIQFFRTQDV